MVVLLTKARADRDATIATGSKVVTADCGHECYIAPSSMAFMESHPEAKTVCEMDIPEQPETAFSQSMLPGAYEELVRDVGPAEAFECLLTAMSPSASKAFADYYRTHPMEES